MTGTFGYPQANIGRFLPNEFLMHDNSVTCTPAQEFSFLSKSRYREMFCSCWLGIFVFTVVTSFRQFVSMSSADEVKVQLHRRLTFCRTSFIVLTFGLQLTFFWNVFRSFSILFIIPTIQNFLLRCCGVKFWVLFTFFSFLSACRTPPLVGKWETHIRMMELCMLCTHESWILREILSAVLALYLVFYLLAIWF